MKILIVNQPLNNRGDESAHKALIRSLHSSMAKDCKIEVLFIGNDSDSIKQFSVEGENIAYTRFHSLRGFFSYRAIVLRWHLPLIFLFLHPLALRIVVKMMSADIVMCAPGGICMGGFQNWGHVHLLLLAMCLRKPIFYYGRSIGPFPEATSDNRLFRKWSYRLLHYFTYISLRDAKSCDIAKEAGIDYMETTDTAFLDSPSCVLPTEVADLIGGGDYMVLVPNSLKWHYAYRDCDQQLIEKFYLLIIQLVEKRFPSLKIVMMPQTFGYGEESDIHYMQRLRSMSDSQRIIVVPDTYSSDVQQKVIAGSQFVIGSRYHSIVFAINQSIPFVSLSYEHKMSGLLNILSLDERMVDITNAFKNTKSVDEAIAQIEQKLLHLDKSKIVAARRMAKDKAQSAFGACIARATKM